ncbi:MAG: ActS/PrrB/RegB family redox-sensitive histidine kinase [Hyphomicrobiaceae bacterium]|nr:ActS/PrrB/RegB family redox-sensitive histidine kinase [Hyphomicrobiaceae bacterium]
MADLTESSSGRLIPSLTSDAGSSEASRLRMQTIIRLRWFGVGGQLFTVAGVYWFFGYDFPIGWCLALIALSAWLNVYLRIRYPARHRLSRSFATVLLAYDVAELAGLLFLTGGLANPFSFLMVAPVTVSAATLPARNTIALGATALGASAALVFWHAPLPWTPGETFGLPILYKLGMLASIAAGMTFLALYAARLSKESRQMSAALAATEHVLAREQKLHALDGLAAAAAHELGTPLATIALVTKELERSASQWPDLAEDVQLLRSQAERCRDILRKLARSPAEQDDPHHASLPVTQLLHEAAMPHSTAKVRIKISAKPQETAVNASSREPIGLRRPGVIYGLGNIVENAVDFARESVDIEARWNERELTITIADDGPGFAPDIIDTLGEPYVTTRRTGERLGRSGAEASGLGLGFFIAKTLLERSGARVALENRDLPETGAVVRVTWARSAFDLPTDDRARSAVGLRAHAAE